MRLKAKRSPQGSSPGRGSRLRLTILLATVAAFLLVPASQAMAAFLSVNIEGSGHGELSSVGGFELGGFEGSPPLACSYNGTSTSGNCEPELEVNEEFELEGIAVHPVAAPGSEFGGFTFNQGGGFGWPHVDPNCIHYLEKGDTECLANQEIGAGTNIEVTAVFNKAAPTGPTNRRTLKITKEAGGPGPVGTVSSKPKGINCATACDEATASMYEGTPVLLKEKPATGDTFSHWTGACSGSGETCTVPMSADEEVGAVFTGSSKPITNPVGLTLSKGESTGTGTVKAAGLACEAECTKAVVLYQGPITLPKPKPGKTVTLTEVAAYGSSFSGWSGCESEPVVEGKGTECVVTMEAAKSVTAEFTAKPKTTLTIDKNSYETGTGTVSSKPKGINCATACTTQTMSVPTGEAIVLKEKPATGMTFTGWSGGGCSGAAETCTVPVSAATTVTATFSGAPKAIVNPQTLTLNKAGSGYGTVKAAGLACETECTTDQVLFQGPITGSKPKPGKTVVLKATSAPGSKTVVWTGCESEPAPGECVVTMEEAKTVTATFDELE